MTETISTTGRPVRAAAIRAREVTQPPPVVVKPKIKRSSRLARLEKLRAKPPKVIPVKAKPPPKKKVLTVKEQRVS
jgi:hypothetical protein